MKRRREMVGRQTDSMKTLIDTARRSSVKMPLSACLGSLTVVSVLILTATRVETSHRPGSPPATLLMAAGHSRQVHAGAEQDRPTTMNDGDNAQQLFMQDGLWWPLVAAEWRPDERRGRRAATSYAQRRLLRRASPDSAPLDAPWPPETDTDQAFQQSHQNQFQQHWHDNQGESLSCMGRGPGD